MNKWIQLAGFIFTVQILAFLSSYFVTHEAVQGWYTQIVKSPLTPPDWVFGPAWTLLYTLIAISLWLLWRNRHAPGARTALILFAAQLVGNYLWSPLFFGMARFAAAFILLLAIDAAILGTMIETRRVSKPAACLLVPYFLWGLFATYLNGYVMLHN